ncbi:RICIN domain-containing protein [Glycomyces harbinensis]|uniref:Lysophospholipase L1 n=1 Tax=Glycomyces harbinensis TaxID=58114 RepID=A0A1G6UVF6_9ACTN|nr:RICIN domain-containing protein [Glycomyces harbinensis]SDD45273.1 Lysophospholipase L1 [Glycomyces harbinensis]
MTPPKHRPNPFGAKLSRRSLGVLAGLGAGAAAGGLLGSGAASAAFTPGAWYHLQSRYSGLVLEIDGASTANGALLVQRNRTYATNQQFRFVAAGAGYYKIEARHSGLALDVYAKSTANGANIVQWTANTGANQQWQIIDDGTWLRFVNRNSGKALDVWEWAIAEGSRVSQYDNLAGVNQQWKLVPAEAAPASGVPTIYVASDSTAQTYNSSAYPMTGWGQKLGGWMDANTRIANHAIGGRSSRSFIEQGRLAAILDAIQPGDYLYVQFGHNDADSSKPERYTSPADYKRYLRDDYMAGAAAKGAIPVLLTPVNRLDYNSSTGQFNTSFATYAAKVHELVSETGVNLIDLGARSRAYLNAIGPDRAKDVFMHLAAGEYPNYPAGLADSTHFQDYGGNQMARLVAEGTRALSRPIAGHVR